MTNNYDFDVTVTCRHKECGESFRTIAVEEVLKLSKYHSHIINGDVTINHQNSNMEVEVLIHVPGNVINASESGYTLEKALDASIEKVKIQLKKIRSKETDHRISLQPEIGEESSEE